MHEGEVMRNEGIVVANPRMRWYIDKKGMMVLQEYVAIYNDPQRTGQWVNIPAAYETNGEAPQ